MFASLIALLGASFGAPYRAVEAAGQTIRARCMMRFSGLGESGRGRDERNGSPG